MTDTAPRLVDTNAAAIAANRSPATIRWWAHRGIIRRRDVDTRGRTLYDLADIYRAANRPTTEPKERTS